ncbi:MAG: DegV family EDD domain-containing protein, partial [Clostridia bacterium]|nr:DegV family EDD domain-containing protein [Clostridia bacterium]
RLQDIGNEYAGKFSLIVCNPPYMAKDAGAHDKDDSVAICRREVALSLDELITAISKCLKYGGRTAIVHRADRLADMRDAGACAEEVYNWAEANKLKIHSWFFSSDLTFFIKNGRISRLAGAFGGVLNICPVMNVDKDGHLKVRQKVRGRKAALATMLSKMESHCQDGADYNQKVFISSSDIYVDARTLADMIEGKFANLAASIDIYSIGTTIGSHTGPGTVALFFWGDERTE